jgi:hypothetical protein
MRRKVPDQPLCAACRARLTGDSVPAARDPEDVELRAEPHRRRYLTLKRATECLQKLGMDVTERTIERWAKDQTIPAVRLGGMWFIDLPALKAGSDLDRTVYEELVAVLNGEGL